MSVAKVIEITGESERGFEAALQEGLDEASDTVDNIQSLWVKDMEAIVEDDEIDRYRVNAKVTFVLEERPTAGVG